MANDGYGGGDGMTYSEFQNRWRRDYADFGTLALVGEKRYTRINLWDSTQLDPPPPSGGGGGSIDRPPTQMK